MKNLTNNQAQGFTLLELLVVMSIIAILSSLAVPYLQDYRARAFDTRAQNDLRLVAVAQEAHFLDEEAYLACTNEACTTLPGITRLSPGVEVSVSVEEFDFIAETSHPSGTGKTFVWDTKQGGFQG